MTTVAAKNRPMHRSAKWLNRLLYLQIGLCLSLLFALVAMRTVDFRTFPDGSLFLELSAGKYSVAMGHEPELPTFWCNIDHHDRPNRTTTVLWHWDSNDSPKPW